MRVGRYLQSNLGYILTDLAVRADGENGITMCQEAIAAFDLALSVYKRENSKSQYNRVSIAEVEARLYLQMFLLRASQGSQRK